MPVTTLLGRNTFVPGNPEEAGMYFYSGRFADNSSIEYSGCHGEVFDTFAGKPGSDGEIIAPLYSGDRLDTEYATK